MAKEVFKIAQISDVHVGDVRFEEAYLNAAITEINAWEPDFLVIAGDLTTNGYREEYQAAKEHFNKLTCERRVVIPGNHDGRNVGYLFFDEIFGERFADFEFASGTDGYEKIRVVAVDSSKPDLNDGEIGRDNYRYVREGFEGEECFKIFILHHHLISIPGTGRERNIVWDAGDVLEELRKSKVDLILNGHKHVPYIWEIDGMRHVTSGTVSTRRTRGPHPPSYNLIEMKSNEVVVTIRTPGAGVVRRESLAR